MKIYDTIPAGFRPVDFDLRMITFGPFFFKMDDRFSTTDRVIYRTDERGENIRVFVGVILYSRPDRVEWVPLKTLYRGFLLGESCVARTSRDAQEFLDFLKGKTLVCKGFEEVTDQAYKDGKPQKDQRFTHSVPTFRVY